ncbi:MAG: UDP-2,3-diacylglucosamine diphosphatase LpxI [Sedimentisphaerales bacterium]|nr:UDP-2,3-diacylglucosamine diphosphatase LpxI [Sedimentisphaerales bacterium]MBN2842682.1 UDP-2,3-diacylglucosamine diphosphatase LpxI [Sedimentisphaerales bacterium]
MSQERILGLIAGQGRLPFMVAQGARRAGLKVACVGFRDQADPLLADEVDHFQWVSVARPGSWIKHLRKYGVSETIMVGRVAKTNIYTPFRIIQYMPDWRAFRVWYGRLGNKDKRNDTLLCALADELANGGIILMDSTKYIPENMAGIGVLTKNQPSESVMKDIDFGWSIVKRMGDLDIGQAIAVKEQEVIAVEAIEGTNKMITRAGELCRAGGWTLIKTGKPSQDMRFDVPTIGPDTIEKLRNCGARCLAIESGKTIIVDTEQTLALADKNKITVVGIDGSEK